MLSGDLLPRTDGSTAIFYNMATQSVVFTRYASRNGASRLQFSFGSVLLIGGQVQNYFPLFVRQFWANGSVVDLQFPVSRLNPNCIALDANRILITGGFTQNWRRCCQLLDTF